MCNRDEAQALAKQVGTTYAVVNTTTLKVRQEASTESAVLGLVPIEEELVVVEELDGWVKVAIEEGDGYVSREYVNLRTDFVHAESKAEEEARLAEEAKEREEARAAAVATEATRAAQAAEQTVQKQAQTEAVIEAAQATAASSAGSEMGKSVIDYATQFVGNPYVYGGTSLTNGTDCSGFVMSVYANFGVSLPHSSSALRSKGYDVGGLANAQPGDMLLRSCSSLHWQWTDRTCKYKQDRNYHFQRKLQKYSCSKKNFLMQDRIKDGVERPHPFTYKTKPKKPGYRY